MDWFYVAPALGAQHRVLRLVAPVAWLGCALLLGGCQRGGDEQFTFTPQVRQLEPPLREAVEQQLIKRCGTPSRPKLLGGDEQDEETLKHGAVVYRRYCQGCHGVSGGGDGPAAEYLVPRPRDFRRGIFKFMSTPYGFKPLHEDLLRTVEQGVAGTAMPSFRRLTQGDREAVVDYVLALTHRGELEQLLAADADAEGELSDEAAAAAVKSVLAQWKQAPQNVLEPATRMPPVTAESIAAGKAAFLKRECFKCHGRDGRGGLAGGIEVGKDAWGQIDPAADLTSGMLHGGQTPLDIYRRISAGINGTPMPAFKDALASEPETIWQLAHYVMALANERRGGVQFPPTAPAASPKTPDQPPGKPTDSPEPAS